MNARTPAAAAARLFLIALLVGATPLGRAVSDPKASRLYEDALVRYEKKDMAGAVIQLKNVLQIDKSNLSAHVLLGKALLANGDSIAAEAALNMALSMGVNRSEIVVPLAEAMLAQGKLDAILSQPRFAPAGLPPDVRYDLLLLRAGAASDKGQANDALRAVQEARELDATSAKSWSAEVPIRIRARQLAQARVAADRAVALDPKSAQAAYQQATVAHVGGDLKTAIELYTRTLSLDPGHVDALVARAGIYIDLRRFDEAAADVKAARRLDAKDPRSAYLASLLAGRSGDSAAAKKALNEVTGLLDPLPIDFIRYRPQILMLGGLSHFGLGQYEKAKPYLETQQRQDPDSPVSKLLAQIYLHDRQTDQAIEALDRYLRSHPGDADAIMLMASAQMAKGRFARSAELMREALAKTDDPSMRALLGMSLIGAGQFAQGAGQLQATLAKDPNQIQAGVSLVGLYLASGQARKARELAEALAKRRPDNAGIANLLGSARAADGDAAGARTAFEQAVRLNPGFVEPQISLARLDIDQKAFDAAKARLDAILAKDDKSVPAALAMADLYGASGKDAEALRWLQRADDNSGPRLDAGLRLVNFYLAHNQLDQAREVIARLRARAPDAQPVLQTAARVQMAAGDTLAARSSLARASGLAGYDAALLTEIATLQLMAGDLAGAAHALDKALSGNPEHLRARAMRAQLYLLQNDPARAEQLARSIVASDPGIGLGYGLLGDVARARAQMPAAIEAYRRAHQFDRSTDSLLRLFAVLEAAQRPAAIALAEQWLREQPKDLRVWRALADAQARAGNMPAARDDYQRLLELSPQDAEALNNLAIVLIALHDPRSMQVAEQALALKPQTPYIIGTAGWAAFNAGQSERALQLLRDARLRDPGNASTRFFLGTVLARQGRKDEAREELETALRASPGFAYAKDAQALLATLK